MFSQWDSNAHHLYPHQGIEGQILDKHKVLRKSSFGPAASSACTGALESAGTSYSGCQMRGVWLW